MKIFFLGAKDQTYYTNYKKVIAILKAAGHQVYDDWMDSSAEDDRTDFEKAYKKNLEWIKNSDVIISEVTAASRGVTFLLAIALEYKKPILAIYSLEAKEKQPSTTIIGSSMTNKLLTYKEYKADSLEAILNNYLREVKKTIDTKFILIISPAIDRYLQWVSENRRMHKAQVVRLALETEMEKDKEYKDYIRKGK